MNTKLLFFSAEAKSPSGTILMKTIYPIQNSFNEKYSDKYLSDKLKNITIVFICTDESMLLQGFYTERRYISHKNNYADIRLLIPYCEFIRACPNERKKMMWEVIKSALDYIRKRKAFVRIDELEHDLYNIYWDKQY